MGLIGGFGSVCPALTAHGAGAVPPGKECHTVRADVHGRASDAGRLVLNTLKIRANVGASPVAERLLRNMLRYAQSTAKAGAGQ